MATSRRRARNRANQEARLAELDRIGTDKAEFSVEEQLTAVELIVGDFIARVQENIEQRQMNVSGKISDITMQRTETGVQVEAFPWLIYHDQGVSGTVNKYNTPFSYTDKMPPPQVFKDWIAAKQINTRNNQPYSGEPQDFEGVDANADSIAFAMAKAKMKEGHPPTLVFSSEIEQMAEELQEKVAELVINKIFKL